MTVAAINPNILKVQGLYDLFKAPPVPKPDLPKPYVKSFAEYTGYSPFSVLQSPWAYVKNMQGSHLQTVNELV